MGRKIWLAALLCVALCLFSGCNKSEQESDTLDDVFISNLKTPDLSLSQEEKAYMDTVKDVMNTAQIKHNGRSDYLITAQNISQQDLDLYLYICGYNKEGDLVCEDWHTLHQWEKGQKCEYDLGIDSSADVEEFKLIGEYSYNGTWYQTDPLLLPVGEEDVLGFNVRYAQELPAVVKLEQSWGKPISYTLLDVTLTNDSYATNSYQLILRLRKENGDDNTGDSIPVRIVDEDNNVQYTASEYVYLGRGETALVTVDITLYDPGDYYLEMR